MEALATDRMRPSAGRAPGGLGLVQELINTSTRAPDAAPARLSDLLAADVETANGWLSAALARWSAETGQPAPALRLGEADLAPLRKLRESVRDLTSVSASGDTDAHAPRESAIAEGVGGTGDAHEVSAAFPPAGGSVALRVGTDGRVHYGTTAAGWRGVATLVTAEILLAQHTGSWLRFKTCPYPVCGVAFYDESRNNSRVWHDVRTCGNRTNLAASRERRRSAS